MYLFLNIKERLKEIYVKLFGIVLWTTINDKDLVINDSAAKTFLAFSQKVSQLKAVIGADEQSPGHVLGKGWHPA